MKKNIGDLNYAISVSEMGVIKKGTATQYHPARHFA